MFPLKWEIVPVFPLKWEIVPVFPAHLRNDDGLAFCATPKRFFKTIYPMGHLFLNPPIHLPLFLDIVASLC